MTKLTKEIRSTALGLVIVFALLVASVAATLYISSADAAAKPPQACSTEGTVTLMTHYTILAKMGSVEAMARIGYLYYLGRGVEKNHESAFVWLSMAGVKGHKAAAKIVALMITKMTPEQIKAADDKIFDMTLYRVKRVWF